MSWLVVPARTRQVPATGHAPDCAHVRAGTGSLVSELPAGTVVCAWCHGRPAPAWKAILKRLRTPTRSKVSNHFAGQRTAEDLRCPSCGSENVEKDGVMAWVCWNCPWEGTIGELDGKVS